MPLLDDAGSLLEAVTSIPSVSVALVMDRDGFVIEWAGEMRVDAEDVAAVASSLLESCGRIGRDLGQGAVRNVICEFDEGVMLVIGAHVTTRLAVVLRDPAAIDAVRSRVMQVMPALQRL